MTDANMTSLTSSVSLAGSPSTSSSLLSVAGMDGDRDRIETAMRDAVVTTDDYLTEIASHLIVAGGKRLRPVLSVVAGRLAGDSYHPVADDVILGGVACELVHLGSLYHDDVMDEAETRRGVETVNARWGNLQAILAGDFLLSRASEIAASLGTEVAGLLARTIGRLCEGQIEELKTTYRLDRSESSYFESIEGKTASLYGTAARIGGIVAALPRDQIDALTDFGTAYGMVFQIVDDVLDLTSTSINLGKPAGHDLEEGVYTLPVLRTLTQDDPSADELRALLGGPLSAHARDAAVELVRSGPGIESALATARDFAAQAVMACDALPDGPVTDALRAAPTDLIDDLVAAS